MPATLGYRLAKIMFRQENEEEDFLVHISYRQAPSPKVLASPSVYLTEVEDDNFSCTPRKCSPCKTNFSHWSNVSTTSPGLWGTATQRGGVLTLQPRKAFPTLNWFLLDVKRSDLL